jgi:O-antigen/teichoic acid export membrane protein
MSVSNEEKVDKTVSDILHMSVGNNVSRVLIAFSGMLVSRYLGPFLNGVSGFLNMIYQYSDYAHAPFRGALARELPYYQGLGDSKKVEDMQNASFTVIVAISLCVSVGILGASFFFADKYELRIGLQAYSIISFMMSVSAYLVVFYRTRKQFYDLSVYMMLNGVLIFVTTIVLSYFYGFIGLLAALIISNVVSLTFLFQRTKYKFKMLINPSLVKMLIVRGLPLMFCGYIFVTFRQLDRLVVVSFLGFNALGYYKIAVQVCDMLYLIPATIWSVIFPSFLQRSAIYKSNVPALKSEVIYNATTTAAVIPVFFLWAAIGIPWLIHIVLPDYEPSILPTQILMMGTYYLGLFEMFYYVYLVADRVRYVIMIGAVMLIAAALTMWGATQLGFDINGVAAAASVCSFLFMVLVSSVSGTLMKLTVREHLKLQWLLLFPLLHALLSFIVATRLTPKLGTSVLAQTMEFVIGVVVGTLLYVPTLIWIDRKTTIVRRTGQEAIEKAKNLFHTIARKTIHDERTKR